MMGPLLLAAAEQAQTTSGTQVLVAALGAGSLGAILAAIVTGLFSKRKLGAEATEIITKAASGVVENLNGEIVRVTGLLTEVRAEVARKDAEHQTQIQALTAKYDRRMEEVRHTLQLHSAWDTIVKAKAADAGVLLPEAPPLLPPPRD